MTQVIIIATEIKTKSDDILWSGLTVFYWLIIIYQEYLLIYKQRSHVVIQTSGDKARSLIELNLN